MRRIEGLSRFDGYGVLLTGAGSGIGAATAHRLAAEGAHVLVTDVDERRAVTTAEDITKAGYLASAMACDVTDQQAVDAAIDHAVRHLGRLDTLVNCAFSTHRDTELFENTSDDAWLRDFDATLHGAFRCARAAMPHLAAADGRGTIVSIGSVNGEQDFGGHAYSAAKAGLASLTRTLAVQNGPRGVRVNLVAPGTIDTPSWDDRPAALVRAAESYPLGRVGLPEDVAAGVAFLASVDAAWITGLTLPVDGGILISNLGLRNGINRVEPE